MVFSNYVPGIWITDALNTILAASRGVAIENLRGNGKMPIGKNLMYSFGSVKLVFVPGASLTWSEWGLALSALTEVFDKYDSTCFSFTVRVYLGQAGTGFLRKVAIATPLAIPQATPQAA